MQRRVCGSGPEYGRNRLTVKQTTGEAAGKLFYNLNLRDGQYFYLAVK